MRGSRIEMHEAMYEVYSRSYFVWKGENTFGPDRRLYRASRAFLP